jgi:tripeptide aminopeptidase
MLLMKNLLARFFSYIEFDTQADERQNGCPSTPGQLSLARHLAGELTALGLQQVELDDKGYLTALLPSNVASPVPAIGFIAHMDTAPDFSGHQVRAQLVEAYQGGDIALGCGQEVLSPMDFPSLRQYLGQDLITTDGTTLLGADDKAGICEIITAMAHLLDHPEIPHGDIYLGFTPDEEIGRGADLFPLDRFKAQWAYTVDGGELGELEFENFNAATVIVRVQGNNVHPGTAKDIMVNSQTLAAQFHASMPADETPEHTEGYQGFYHLIGSQGSVEESTLTYILRDFESEGFARRQKFMLDKVAEWNARPGPPRFSIAIKESYRNMRDQVIPHRHIIDIAEQAMQEVGVKPKIKPIRGGTDGSRLSFMGLPCPNLFTGGHNFHGKHEYIPVPSMEKAVATLIAIARLTVTQTSPR